MNKALRQCPGSYDIALVFAFYTRGKKNNTNYAIYRYILKCFRNPLAMQIVLGFFNILKI